MCKYGDVKDLGGVVRTHENPLQVGVPWRQVLD
jgi:hypothetical protein